MLTSRKTLLPLMRGIHGPLASTWFNQRIDDPQVRATMFSVRGQVDAVGQITSGPIMGMIGNASIRAALVASAAILSPVLPLYWITIFRLIFRNQWAHFADQMPRSARTSGSSSMREPCAPTS
jgi:hypothetical protein